LITHITQIHKELEHNLQYEEPDEHII
jgi:hypothetical protein